MSANGTAPHNLEAEQALLGAVFLAGEGVLDAAARDGLTADDFYNHGHGAIWDAMRVLRDRGDGLDVATVAHELTVQRNLDDVGGRATVEMLAAAVPHAGNRKTYARMIRDAAAARHRIRVAHDVIAHPFDAARYDRLTASVPGGDSSRRVWARHADRTSDGASFLLDAPATVPAIWGRGHQIAWARDEALMIYAPQGVGKTTVGGQLALARAGIGSGEVFGLPVAPDDKRVLYIAADRPQQIRRSFARMVTPADHQQLADKLVFWSGPLPFNIVDDPQTLAAFALDHGAGSLFADSIKDLAVGLANDEVGAAVNLAIQHVIAAGIQVVDLHHPRKAQVGNAKPRTLDDVFGSTWLTSGHGSVILLWGKAGDAIVEVEHLKQPDEPIGPFKVIHDHVTGHSTRWQAVELVDILRNRPNGMSVRDAAVAMFAVTDPEPNVLEKARRRLRALVTEGVAYIDEGGDGKGARYHAKPKRGPAWGQRDPQRGVTDEPTLGSQPSHADPTHPTNRPEGPSSPLKGGRDQNVGTAFGDDDLLVRRAQRLEAIHGQNLDDAA